MHRLVSLIGPSKAKELIFTADIIDSYSAEKLGKFCERTYINLALYKASSITLLINLRD